MSHFVKIIFLLFIVIDMGIASHTVSKKLYDISRAMVTYKISGGGVLSDEVNLTIKGRAKLRFKEWGKVRLYERHIEEVSTGAIHYRTQNDECHKYEGDMIFDVDYVNKKILNRPLPKGEKYDDLTVGLTRKGQQMVADVVCDMWEGEGIRRCLYKGIPLFSEYEIFGLRYREEAVSFIQEINTSNSACAIPSYPLEKFALYTKSFKTKSKLAPKDYIERLHTVIDLVKRKGLDLDRVPEKIRIQMIDIVAEPIFTMQKKLLPKLLMSLKRTRACLIRANDTLSANSCLKEIVLLKKRFTDNEDNHIDHWEEEREELLNTFEQDILFLEVRMQCIRSAKRFSDLAECMKKERAGGE